MRHPQRLLIIASLLALALPCFAQKPKSIKIGFSIEANNGERWQTDLAEFQERAAQLGADVLVRFANGDDDLQFKQVKELLDQHADVLVVLPHNTETSGRIVDAAHARHVSVISYDRLIHNAPVDLYVGFDLFTVGTLQAQALVAKAPKGNYILLGGSPLDINSKVVRSGQMKVLQPYIDRGDIKIVADLWVPDWSPTQAYVLVAQALENPTGPITAIVASNDGIAGAAIQALQDKNPSENVLVSGQDADLAAIVRLYDGSQLMTVYKPLPEEARAAATAAVQLAKHEDIEAPAIPNGSLTAKAILLTPIAVSRENAKDTVIKDGFQKIEIVKQALPKDKWPELGDASTERASKN
jgi:D-xylose transport system substrate-binding protein